MGSDLPGARLLHLAQLSLRFQRRRCVGEL